MEWSPVRQLYLGGGFNFFYIYFYFTLFIIGFFFIKNGPFFSFLIGVLRKVW